MDPVISYRRIQKPDSAIPSPVSLGTGQDRDRVNGNGRPLSGSSSSISRQRRRTVRRRTLGGGGLPWQGRRWKRIVWIWIRRGGHILLRICFRDSHIWIFRKDHNILPFSGSLIVRHNQSCSLRYDTTFNICEYFQKVIPFRRLAFLFYFCYCVTRKGGHTYADRTFIDTFRLYL